MRLILTVTRKNGAKDDIQIAEGNFDTLKAQYNEFKNRDCHNKSLIAIYDGDSLICSCGF